MRKIAPKKKAARFGSHTSNLVKVVTFKDEEWARIADASLLPEGARIQIGAAIAHYRSEVAAERTSLNTKRSVVKIRGYATKLEQGLRNLLNDPIFFTAGLPHWSSIPKPQASEFKHLFENLEQLQLVMARTQSRMHMKPGRKSIQPIDALIARLNWIQASVTGDNVRRSTKIILGGRPANIYIELCCKKADSDLTQVRIDRALRRNVAKFHDILINHGFDTSVGKYVDEHHQPKSSRSRAYIDGHLRFRQEDILKHLRAKKKFKRK
jgi:hypothetical protein